MTGQPHLDERWRERNRMIATATGFGLAIAFGVGLLLQFLVRGSISQWGETATLWLCGLAGAVCLAVGLVGAYRARLATILDKLLTPKWMRPELHRVHAEPASRAEILVIGVSPGMGISSAFLTLRHHLMTVRRVYALHTPDADAIASLRRLEDEARALELPTGVIEPVELPPSAVHDPSPVFTAISAILRRVGPEADIVLDYTGGTKAFTAAMALAAAADGRRLGYVIPDKRDENARAASGTDGRVVEVGLEFEAHADLRRS